MASALTHRYIPRTEYKQENLFMEEYYCSTDTKIYIDDVEHTEISQISYAVQEQLKPLYGYASRTFDDVAVGNRIVVGTIHVPIKNIEKHSTMNDIISHSGGATIQDYNDAQLELMDSIDWITGMQSNNILVEHVDEDDITFSYRSKLIQLGYNLDYSSSAYILQAQIKRFQEDSKLEITGKLDIETMKKIDEAIYNQGIEILSVPENTCLYMGPSLAFAYEVLTEAQNVYVIENEYQGGWIHVRTKDGREGFVNKHQMAGGWSK